VVTGNQIGEYTMNKYFKLASVISVLIALVVFAGVTAAFAQGPNQPDDFTPPGANQAGNEVSPGLGARAVDEATMHEAIANALGISLEAFEEATAEGKTPLILAQELGVDFGTVQAAMGAAHEAALQQALNDGLLGQEQANLMLSRQGGQNSQSGVLNRGQSNGPVGRMGQGAGGNGAQAGVCQYQTP
jgi:hypothetical protein